MTFGLKNAGATYQRAMNFIFHEFIGKLVEIYIDDVVVKSGDFTKHLADLRKVLECTSTTRNVAFYDKILRDGALNRHIMYHNMMEKISLSQIGESHVFL